MVDPVALGAGTPIFKDLKRKLDLKLTMTRTFKSGVVLLSYEPM
jgi:dihydrofolate reductase